MTEKFKYGIAAVDELQSVVEIKMAMFREVGLSDLLAPNAESIILEDYQKLYAENKAKHFVARAEGIIVASAGAFIKSDLPFRYFEPRCYGFIGDVYTQPSLRGNGIATKLNVEAISWLGSRGIKSVRLLASDVGRPIYERLGFSASDEMILTIEA